MSVLVQKCKENVQSPCVEACFLNREIICMGCFRSLAEITGWQEMDDKMRLAVMCRTERRRKAHKTKSKRPVT